jgi:penicillin-binding protein 2
VTGFDLRLRIFGFFVSALLALLTVRLWMLQLTRWVDFTGQALANRTSIVSSPAPRGLIFDRNGRVLAENRPSWGITITPANLPEDDAEREQVVTRLASVLRDRGVSTTQVRAAIDEIRAQRHVRPMDLGRFADDLPLEIVAQVEEQRLDLPGVNISERFKRFYPHRELAAHVLGYARPISAEQYERWKHLQYPQPEGAPEEPGLGVEPWRDDPVYSQDSIFGQSGIEAAAELDTSVDPPVPILQGRRGMRVWEVDVLNRPQRLIREERVAQEGAGVYLTIDLDLQQVAEEALTKAVGATRTGAVVLLDVHTGEVYAMASKPSIDPNLWVKGFSSEEYRRLLDDPRNPFYNKAVQGTYPPGSIFKMISATAALETTDVTPTTSYACHGEIYVGAGRQRFGCWKNHGGYLNMWQGIAQSCDVYFYETVRKGGLTSDALAHYARLFGLGERTGIGLPDEAEGLVPDREWKADARNEDWYTGDTLQMVMGQSFLRVTPLQMAVATATVANGGSVIRPRVVRKIQWPEYLRRAPTLFPPEVRRRLPVAPETLAVVREGMRRAVTDTNGTAHWIARSGLPLAGKTGSAQTFPNRPTHAWFVCYGPYDNPRFACAVLVTEGGHGSEAAGPVALAVMAEALHKYGSAGSANLQELVAGATQAAATGEGD